MTNDRRRFLSTTGFSIAGGLLPTTRPGSNQSSIATQASESTTDLLDWSAVGDQFDL
jgi:hypothetical protein